MNYFSLAPKNLAQLNRAFDMRLGEMDIEVAKREGRFRVSSVSNGCGQIIDS